MKNKPTNIKALFTDEAIDLLINYSESINWVINEMYADAFVYGSPCRVDDTGIWDENDRQAIRQIHTLVTGIVSACNWFNDRANIETVDADIVALFKSYTEGVRKSDISKYLEQMLMTSTVYRYSNAVNFDFKRSDDICQSYMMLKDFISGILWMK